MKHGSTLFLKIVILLIATVTSAALLRFPQTEGRAANLDFISIYADPVIIYMYIASIPFFMILYQAFTLLRLIEKKKFFSSSSVTAVRMIKYSAVAIIAFMVGAEAYIFIVERGRSDDIAGGVAGGLMVIFVALVIAATASVIQKILQNNK